MKKTTDTKIAKNVSSGAEKVERIEEEKIVKGKVSPETKGAGTRRMTTVKTKTTQKKPETVEAAVASEGLAERESERAKKRVELALIRKEKEAERAEQKKQLRAERKKEEEKLLDEYEKQFKARREAWLKRAQERKERLQAENAELERKLQERRAERKAEREKQKANKGKKQATAKKGERKERKERGSGHGGWLAAVISLGAVTLALTTVLTVGALDMNGMSEAAMTGHRATMYEFIGVMENVDEDLDRVRVSATPVQQSRILTDLLVQARLAEADLAKMPIDGQADANLTTFINRTATTAEMLLGKLRRGEPLSEADGQKLEALYQVNHTVRSGLEKIATKMTKKDLKGFMKGAKNTINETLQNVENATLPENSVGSAKMTDQPILDEMKEKMDDLKDKGKDALKDMGVDLDKMKDKIKDKTDEGFRSTPNEEDKGTKLASSQVEEKLREQLSDYQIAKIECTGETVTRGLETYNFMMKDKDGVEMFAQASQIDGSLVYFNYYKACDKQNFSSENAMTIAENFLEKLGYDGMRATRLSENGTNADFLFVTQKDGFLYYPKAIKVKVCEERGVVVGFDASKYMKNGGGMVEPNAKITIGEAQAKLHKDLVVIHSAPCVVEANGRPRTAYEFLCRYGEEQYLVYIDAKTGDEISILNTRELA